ncbi:MAG: DegT/DnrJ/EryC1/StrS family aminotransferase [Fischerella sp. CENA71]|nr:DegT/DnrJ/EryC1/StrS family aminotransferase [Fischerella sp. CENA71]
MSEQKLALMGGKPVSESLVCPQWPPVEEATSQKLVDIYWSRQWSFNGLYERNFAYNFATFHDVKYGVFMTNGTVTLQCALAAYGIGKGDEVIVPALTWLATAMAVSYLGAIPVFVDIEPTTLCLDPKKVKLAITDKTRAIIPVHLYGSMADLDAILDIAQHHNLVVIEDCAHTHGGRWRDRRVGSWGDVGSFSFQQSKVMASGEGGICITNNAETAERLFRLKHIGYASYMSKGQTISGSTSELTCYNFRATEFQAAILENQLLGLEQRLATYNQNAARLKSHLADVPGVRMQVQGKAANPQSYYALVLIFDEEPLVRVPLKILLKAIAAEGLHINPTYGAVYQHILFNLPKTKYRVAETLCPVAEELATKHCATIAHQWLGADEQTINIISDILIKVIVNAEALVYKYA